jgi:hypothetical protein
VAIARLSEAATKGMGGGRFDATVILSSNRIVTPAITSSSTLKLITWEVENSGAINRIGDSGDLGAGAVITSVSTPAVSQPAKLPTVFRRANGELGLLVWKVKQADGTFTIVTSGIGGDVVTGLAGESDAESFVSVWRNTLGNLHLHRRGLGALGDLGGAKAGAVSAVGHPVMSDVLVTPVIVDCSDVMRLIAWHLDKTGSPVRVGDSGNAGGKASRVALTQIGGKWATATRVGDDYKSVTGGLGQLTEGLLRISFWERDNDGFHRVADQITTIPIADVDAVGLDYNDTGFGQAEEQYRIVTAVRTMNGKLRLMIWSWLPQKALIRSDADSGEQPDLINYLRLRNLANDLFVTVVRDASPDAKKKPINRTKLISWRIQ